MWDTGIEGAPDATLHIIPSAQMKCLDNSRIVVLTTIAETNLLKGCNKILNLLRRLVVAAALGIVDRV